MGPGKIDGGAERQLLFWVLTAVLVVAGVWLAYEAWAVRRACNKHCISQGFPAGEYHVGARMSPSWCECVGSARP